MTTSTTHRSSVSALALVLALGVALPAPAHAEGPARRGPSLKQRLASIRGKVFRGAVGSLWRAGGWSRAFEKSRVGRGLLYGEAVSNARDFLPREEQVKVLSALREANAATRASSAEARSCASRFMGTPRAVATVEARVPAVGGGGTRRIGFSTRRVTTNDHTWAKSGYVRGPSRSFRWMAQVFGERGQHGRVVRVWEGAGNLELRPNGSNPVEREAWYLIDGKGKVLARTGHWKELAGPLEALHERTGGKTPDSSYASWLPYKLGSVLGESQTRPDRDNFAIYW